MIVEPFVDIDGDKYVSPDNQFEQIKVGDFAYNPNAEVVIPIGEDDDLTYVNDNYYKVIPVSESKS